MASLKSSRSFYDMPLVILSRLARAADSLDVSIRAPSEHAAKNIEQATEILRRFFIRHIRFYNRNLYAL